MSDKSVNKLWRESGKKLPFPLFLEEFKKQNMQQEVIKEDMPTKSGNTTIATVIPTRKDYSAFQIVALIGIVVGTYFLIKD